MSALYNVETREEQTVQIQTVAPQSLFEACARFIGQSLPFELVQLHPQRVPEEVQKRIVYWSFPLKEKRLLEFEYTKISMMGATEPERIPVENMTQIGMYLAGTVIDLLQGPDRYIRSGTKRPMSLCVQFDRGRITSTTCSCRSSSKWCEHVILLCIARIRGIVPCEIHPPVSEILSYLNRDQLQKLIQNFLEKHPQVGILPMVALASQLRDKEFEINKQCGAPDPTAWGCTSKVPRWQIGEQVAISQLRKGLQNLNFSKDGFTGIQDFKTREEQTVQIQTVAPRSLFETCARFIGQNFPFELVQLHPQRVPEEVQKRIVYWSFPLKEKRLLEHAKMMGVTEQTMSRVMRSLDLKELDKKYIVKKQRNIASDDSHVHSPDRIPIENITQIGMYLAGTVIDLLQGPDRYNRSGTKRPISLCVQFDRGCITSTTCSCHSSSKWCEHVIWLCLARIRGIVPCEIHPPMSEILSYFNRDQLQKLIQHFLEKRPLVGILPMVALASQLRDKEFEINKQCGAPDPTAGGCISEVPRWQIDEQAVISQLRKGLQNLNFSKDSFTGIQDFKFFAAFLQNHDENITIAFKWFLEIIDSRKKLEISRCGEDQYGQLYPRESYSWKLSNLVCLVLMQGLQIFFVDPFISKACKEEITDLVKSQDAFALSEHLTDYYTSLLQEAVLVSKENPRPTLQYLKELQSALQGAISSADSVCREGSNDKSRILLSSLVAVLRYWLFHKHPHNPASSAVALDICRSVFPAIPLVKLTFENLVVVNKCLEFTPISSLLRHGYVLMEYLIPLGFNQGDIVNFATKLLGASSVGMSAIVQTASKGNFLFVTQLEEAILRLVQQHISCEHELFTPVLRQIVKEYLHRDVGEGVFIWPWSLLRLAALDPLMVEDVREVTQNLIGNANSILHCTSQTDQVYPPHVVDLVRDSLLSLLQYLFRTLQTVSAQVLFTTLSNAFPFPITYSAKRSLPDELQENIDYEIQEELQERLKVGVLPNLQCDPSLLRLVQQNSEFTRASEAIQNILLKSLIAKYSIDSNHEVFMKKLNMLQLHRNHSLKFQLQLLYLRVSTSRSGYYGRGIMLTDDQKLQLDTPSGRKAFLYLVDNWQYCLNPSEVLDIIVSKLDTNVESPGHEDEVAQLISTVLLADKDAVKSMRHSSKSIDNILARSKSKS